jgi:hypothetical protein
MSPDLRDAFHRLADTAPAHTPDPAAWDRGRAVRRRDRGLAVLAVVALVAALGGLGALVTRPGGVAPADGRAVPGGAIPSRIVDVAASPDAPAVETDLALGRASVAFFSAAGTPTLVGATDGRYHLVRLPGLRANLGPLALSPDGVRLAWTTSEAQVAVADLTTGRVVTHRAGDGVDGLRWSADSRRLVWLAGRTAGEITADGRRRLPAPDPFLRGLASPDGALAALPTGGGSRAVPFRRPGGSGTLRRTLPADLYPHGAAVTPLGWASDHLVLAQVQAPAGSYVEGDHLVLFTSPDRPKRAWTFRIVARDLPSVNLSVAVDLVPDLDGTSFQSLTHDFATPASGPSSRAVLGRALAGSAVLLALLLAAYAVRRRP